MIKEFELIVTIVEKGQSDKVVEASRQGGAKGGTIIYGKGTNYKQGESVFGIELKSEKEIVFTIVSSSQKNEIMKLISEQANLSKAGVGLCFSLPINSIVGSKKIVGKVPYDTPNFAKNSMPSPNKIEKNTTQNN